ncbi:sigma-54-dependent transcriptional regulator [candidate division KSB1 bacterium]
MNSILIADGLESMRESLVTLFTQEGYSVTEGCTLSHALELLHDDFFDIIIVDVHSGTLECLEFIRAAKKISPITESILITPQNSIDIAIKVIREGAYSYISKPFEYEEIVFAVERALEKRELVSKIDSLEEELKTKYRFDSTIGSSPEILNVLKTVVKVSSTDSSVLITGEPGTGKEVIARSIHYNSGRSENPFVEFSCSQVAQEAHEKKLFSDANRLKSGNNNSNLIYTVHGGTLVLNEIGKLSIPAQDRLLRHLQHSNVKKPDSPIDGAPNIRIIATTSEDMRQKVKDGLFDKDLFAMINIIPVYIPPLRERKSDIESLIQYFLKVFSEKMKRADINISPRAVTMLESYNWPGNVKELENVIRRSVAVCKSDMIAPADLPVEINKEYGQMIHKAIERDFTLAELEKEYILEVLEYTSWNKTKAAGKLGITRATLLNKLKLYKNGQKVNA